jgi:hypothetical protein
MTITIDIAPEVEAELARQAAEQGIGIDAYAAELLAGAALRSVESDKRTSSTPPPEVIEAIERLKSFGRTHGLSLGGTTIRELRDESRP